MIYRPARATEWNRGCQPHRWPCGCLTDTNWRRRSDA